MGQTLSEPVVDKHTASGEDERLMWGVSEMQGWRTTMEDAHAHVLSLGPERDGAKTSFFAVYDGHGGSTVARFAGDTVHHRLAANEAFKKQDYVAALKRAYLETDEDLRANPDFVGDPSGCTAVSAIITSDLTLICANAGDSRAVMSLGGEAKPLSFDHKPTNRAEKSRIVAAGGFVEMDRVNGNLALSRALGDFEFKQGANLEPEHQIVTADPDINIHTHTEEDEFLVIACDGIWDVLKSQEVINNVRLGIAERKELSTICEDLMDQCLAPDPDWGGLGADNMTAMVIAILGNRTKEEWYDWVAERVEKGVPYPTPKEYTEPFASGGQSSAPTSILSRTRLQALGSEDDDGDESELMALQEALKAKMREHLLSLERDDEPTEAAKDGGAAPTSREGSAGSVTSPPGEDPKSS
ncbi:BQ5605_C015g07862 [Microbotryum silenes-dioicae]|uniref:protein-serine/threonine phosphatase n=1 Tax=Microbotryum silenes-dioicae TaxID=796604 RepID=A0A2X0MEM1_9BASI|nr:BQ5605_C015g07862 [Microbotryum silenes-dioicae]